MDERDRLIEGARGLGLTLAPGDADRLLRLLDELGHWNRAYNLTAIVERDRMLTHHLLDSLAIHADVTGLTVADVGTGAGFPGLPLAIVDPGRRYTLLDSNNKKIRFVSHAARALELPNVTAAHSRVEALRPEAPFDTVVTRAFAAIPDMLDRVGPLCGPGTRVLAMKGRFPRKELGSLPAGWRVVESRVLDVPGLPDARSLVRLERHAP
jgi:16S rRNA (guanine527-N7)-methyltransferase